MIDLIALMLVVSAGAILQYRWVTSTVDTFTAENEQSHIQALGAAFGVSQQGASESNSEYKERVLNKIRNPVIK